MSLNFAYRHNGPNEAQVSSMLDVLGLDSLDALVKQTIPSDILIDTPLQLDEAVSENDYLCSLKKLAEKNQTFRSMIGMGFYGCASPAVIIRNIFENPSWYTSYTPYQAEISQGRLEALIVFQTMISSLTGSFLTNCSMLDDATAAAKAMRMMYNLRSREEVKEGRNRFFVDSNIFPQVLSVLQTRALPLGFEIEIGNYAECDFAKKYFGAFIQYPA